LVLYAVLEALHDDSFIYCFSIFSGGALLKFETLRVIFLLREVLNLANDPIGSCMDDRCVAEWEES
jgi:hypothetical protein